jgi:circadian clock protein KaiB
VKRPVSFKFSLFVAGNALNSVRARANLAVLCQSHLKGRCEIEIVDVFKEPQRALAEGIFMTPTLIKRMPAPVRRIVGTLGDADILLQTLAIEPAPA